MPNQKISELTAIVTVDNSVDVLPIVDISANTTKKVTPNALKTALALDNVNNTSDANKPVSIAQQDALNAKVDENAPITAGTAPKITFDAKGLVTSGDSLDETDLPTGINANKIGTGAVSSTEFGYLDGVTSAIQTQIDGKQATLVSGTNIKTVNSTSLLGSGDIAISANPSGVSGAIQFSNGSAFASDAANLFWDDTNNRLGVGTNAPSVPFEVLGNAWVNAVANADATFSIGNPSRRWDVKALQSGAYYQVIYNNGLIGQSIDYLGNVAFGNVATLGARVGIKGSGSTSATTSLLVQNSAGTSALQVRDDLLVVLGGGLNMSSGTLTAVSVDCSSGVFAPSGGNGVKWGSNVFAISNTNGILKLSNGTNSDWDRLQFGGTTSSFPAIKKVSNNIEIRNADDTFGAGLSVGAALNASAILQASSTTKGFLPPVMTTTQKNAIASPATGLVLYDSTTNKLQCYNGSTWNDLF
jgi:hypothetical protein